MMVSRQRYSSFVTPTPLPAGDCLVIGFLGGLEAWDAEDQGVRKVALALRARKLSGLHVETVEEKKRKLALELIRRGFDRDGDGVLDESERRSVRVVVYGMSFCCAAVVEV